MNYQKLTAEKFNEIYSDEEWRNEVAYAHGVQLASGETFKGSCSYPVRYRVTEEQIEEAQKEINRKKEEIYKNHSNDLLFVSMGMDYAPRFEDDVCNHRIRTEFINKDGKHFFIEVGTGREDEMRVDFSIDRDLQNEMDKKAGEVRLKLSNAIDKNNFLLVAKLRNDLQDAMRQPYYNYGGLERGNNIKIKHSHLKYTKENVLFLVNDVFDCDFKNIIVDPHTISTGDKEILCSSPKS